jgi:hypothetical protein
VSYWGSRLPRSVARACRPRTIVDGKMNRLESRYAAHLQLRQIGGEIGDFGFQRMKLRLAAATFYEIDFDLQLPNGEIEIHEVKGHWEDDARVKIKVAARAFPFRFYGVTCSSGRDGKRAGWNLELIAP